MQKVVLYFPDVTSMAEFVLQCKVSKVIIDSAEKMLKGTLTDQQLKDACRQYGARIKESITIRNFVRN